MIQIFADTADPQQILELAQDSRIAGFTTNPTLLRKAGVTDYAAYARAVVSAIGDKPISFPVLADKPEEIERQARIIHEWGPNVYVKVPIVTVDGRENTVLIQRLSRAAIRVNVTAVFSPHQICLAAYALGSGAPAFISIFMGRVCDSWRTDLNGLWKPQDLARDAVSRVRLQSQIKIIWASTRQAYNVHEAEQAGCHVITMAPDLIAKLALSGKSWDEFSLETVRQFAADAHASGLNV